MPRLTLRVPEDLYEEIEKCHRTYYPQKNRADFIRLMLWRGLARTDEQKVPPQDRL